MSACVLRLHDMRKIYNVIMLLNIFVITILLAINKQILKCTQFFCSAAFSILLKYDKLLVEFKTNENILVNKLNFKLNIKGTNKMTVTF